MASWSRPNLVRSRTPAPRGQLSGVDRTWLGRGPPIPRRLRRVSAVYRVGRVGRRSRSARDLGPSCFVRLYIGAGAPGQSWAGLPVNIDSEGFQRVVRSVTNRFGGATYYRARGLWKGGGEDTIVVELFPSEKISCAALASRGERAAGELARRLRQSAVLCVSVGVDGRVRSAYVPKAGRRSA